jgi:mRNA-degrading endonuclease RelE of RelBE toxin-antitoxin system
VWSGAAERSLKKLEADVVARVLDAVAQFAETGHGDVARMTGIKPPTFRLRVGDPRVLFAYDPGKATIVVRNIAHRREVYR